MRLRIGAGPARHIREVPNVRPEILRALRSRAEGGGDVAG